MGPSASIAMDGSKSGPLSACQTRARRSEPPVYSILSQSNRQPDGECSRNLGNERAIPRKCETGLTSVVCFIDRSHRMRRTLSTSHEAERANNQAAALTRHQNATRLSRHDNSHPVLVTVLTTSGRAWGSSVTVSIRYIVCDRPCSYVYYNQWCRKATATHWVKVIYRCLGGRHNTNS